MASHPIPPVSPEPSAPPVPDRALTRDEGWKLIISLFGSAKAAYAEVGGAEAWIAAERAAWEE